MRGRLYLERKTCFNINPLYSRATCPYKRTNANQCKYSQIKTSSKRLLALYAHDAIFWSGTSYRYKNISEQTSASVAESLKNDDDGGNENVT